jgi:hypothetical protein
MHLTERHFKKPAFLLKVHMVSAKIYMWGLEAEEGEIMNIKRLRIRYYKTNLNFARSRRRSCTSFLNKNVSKQIYFSGECLEIMEQYGHAAKLYDYICENYEKWEGRNPIKRICLYFLADLLTGVKKFRARFAKGRHPGLETGFAPKSLADNKRGQAGTRKLQKGRAKEQHRQIQGLQARAWITATCSQRPSNTAPAATPVIAGAIVRKHIGRNIRSPIRP